MGSVEKVFDTEEILEGIYDSLQKFNAENITLKETTDLPSELNIDSVATLELVFELEERFDISIPLEALADVTTIEELAGLIQKIVEKK